MPIADDYDAIHARIDQLQEQVEIGYGEGPLADALRAVLTLCMEVEAAPSRGITTSLVRTAIRDVIGEPE